MIPLPIVQEAFHSIGGHRLRTFLTMLGMIIGVGAVVLLLSIGMGSQKMIRASIESLGSNILVITPGAMSLKGVMSMDNPTLTQTDVTAIAALPSVQVVAPASRGLQQQAIAGANNWNTRVTGASPEFLEVRDWELVEGSNFTESDVKRAERVALIGKTVAEKLFPELEPHALLGQVIRMNNLPFKIVGVLASKGQSLDERDQDDTIIIPLSTAQHRLQGNTVFGTVPVIYAKALSSDYLPVAQDEIAERLREMHKLKPHQDDDFSVRNLTAIANTMTETAKILSILLAAIASISLIVGGIGIMNIMLVNVTERTREIGIRKSIGGRERDIMQQFLLEAVMISAAGSFIGLGLGVVGALTAAHFFQITAEISMWSVVLSLSVALTVGIFFGYYPAKRAAQMNPIEALRYQ